MSVVSKQVVSKTAKTTGTKKAEKGKAISKPKTAEKGKAKAVKIAEKKTTPKPTAQTPTASATPTAKPQERNYDIASAKLLALREAYKAKPKEFPNPHNKGNYHDIVWALSHLGVNKPHSFAELKATIAKSDKDGWNAFKSVEPRTENGKGVDERLLQNVEVLQRKDYGNKLLQVGTLILKTKGVVIDILKGKQGERLVKLNTNSAEPLNEFRKFRKA